MSVPEVPKELTDKALKKHSEDLAASKVKKPAVKLTITDHYLGMIRAALEFNTQVIEIATQVIAMDESGRNRTAVNRLQHSFRELNKSYSDRVDAANARIVADFIRTPEENAGKKPTKKS